MIKLYKLGSGIHFTSLWFFITLMGFLCIYTSSLQAQEIKLNSGSWLNNTGATIVVNGKVNNAGTITNSGTGKVKLTGDWLNNGNYIPTGCTVSLVGTSSQILGGANVTTFENLILNNSGGATLSKGITVSNTLSFTNGKITTGSNILTLGTSATINGAGAGKYINGNLEKGIAVSTASKTFEIGDSLYYTPLVFGFTGTTNGAGTLTARTSTGDHPNINISTINPALSVNRYWTLTNTGVTGFSSFDATFSFNPADLDAGAAYSSFITGKYLAATWSYPTTGAITSTSTQATGLTTFGDFQVGQLSGSIATCLYGDNGSTPIVANVMPCITNPVTVSTTFAAHQYFTMNVINGITYQVYTCNSTSPANPLKLVVYKEGSPADAYLAFSSSNTGNPYSSAANNVYVSFTPAFSGQVRVLINMATDCSSITPSGLTVNVNVSGGSNLLDLQTTAGTDSWIGHIYDGTNSTVAFNDNFSNYLGYYSETEVFNELFGGSINCFSPVNSNGIPRATIYTETFSVRYRMNSTKRGLYIADMGSDDGSRLTVDGALLYNNWSDQAFSSRPRVLMSLNGASLLVLDFYENSGVNQIVFQNLTLVISNTLSANITQSICLGNSGSAISGDIYGTLPTGISLSGTGYQWTYSTTPSGIRTAISGATAATFTPNASVTPFNVPGTFYVYRNTVLSSSNNISPIPYIATNESNASTITINPSPAATFSYTGTPYCSNAVNPSPTYSGGGIAGIFSSTAGLNFISIATGQVNLATSSAGTYTVTNTIPAASGCLQVTATTSITINPDLPVSISVSHSANPACAGIMVTFTATSVNGGTTPTYQWKLNGSNVGTNSNTYTNSALVSGNTVSCVLTSNASPCATGSPASSNTVTMIVNPVMPVSLSIAADPTGAICSGTGVTLSTYALPASTPAILISEAFNSPTNNWTTVNNTTGGIPANAAWTLQPDGNHGITSNDASQFYFSDSDAPGSGSITHTILQSPVMTTLNYSAMSLNFHHYFHKYQADTCRVEVSTNGTSWISVGTYIIDQGTSTVFANPTIDLSTYINNPVFYIRFKYDAPWGFYWAIDNVTISGTPLSSDYNYSWIANPTGTAGLPAGAGTPSAGNAVITANPTATTRYTVTASYGNGCDNSSYTDVTVNPVLPVSVSIGASVNPVCSGTSVTFTAVPFNGGTTPAYQWKVNGVNAGTNSATYAYVPANNDAVTCVLTSNANCAGSPATSNTVTMTATPNLAVSISVGASANPVCLGTSVTFTATPTNGGPTPAYQWKLNGSNVGTNSSTYTNAALTNGNTISCIMTSNATCTSGNPANSNTVTMTINPLMPTSISIVANPSETVCPGIGVTLTTSALPAASPAVLINEGFNSPTNTWTKINNSTGGTPALAAWTLQADGYNYASYGAMHSNDNSQFYFSNSDAQGSGGTASTILQSPVMNTVNYTALALNFYHYFHFHVGGNETAKVEVSTNGTSWTTVKTYVADVGGKAAFVNEPVNLDTYVGNATFYVRFKYDATYDWYWAIDNVTVSGTSTANNYNYSWIASPTGTAGLPAGAGTPSAANATITANPTALTRYTVTASSGSGCDNSNFIDVTVNPNASLASVSGTTPLCIAGTATYTANSAVPGGGTGAWSSSNAAIATVNASGLVTGVTAGTCNITYTITGGCGGTKSALQAVTINPNLPVSIAIAPSANPVCSGTSVTFTATPTNGGATPAYQWKVNGVNAGTNSTTYVYTPANNDIVTCVLTSNATCATGNPATSNMVTITINPFMPTSISIAANPTGAICSGTGVTLTVSPTPANPPAILLYEGFNSPTNTWTKTNNSTGGTPALAAWTLQVEGYYNYGAWHSNDNTQFCFSNSDAQGSGGTTSTILQTPVMSTVNYTALSLNFYHYFEYSTGGGETAKIEVSTNGTSWTTVKTYVADVGGQAAFVNEPINLDTYVGNAIFYVRFKYDATYDWYWAIDNVTVSGTSTANNYNYSWIASPTGTAGLPAGAGTPSAANATITANPTALTRYTVTASSGSGCDNSSYIDVTASPNVSAGVVSGTSPLCISGTATYTTTGAGGSWSSSNVAVATVVAGTGVVTAVSAGTSNITYTISSGCGSPVSAFKTLTVSPNVSAGVVSGTSPLCISGTATFTTTGAGAGGTWSSSNTAVATIIAGTGVVTAVSAGTSNITYTLSSGCGSPVSAFKTLTVSPNVSAGVVSGTSPLCISGTATYTTTGAGGIWSSSNVAVATVIAGTGVVTAVSAGTSNITYTVSSGCGSPVSAFKSLTVSPNVSAGVVSGTSPLCISGTATYTTTSAGGSWSSSNVAVATIIAGTGVVTAVSAGTSNITYTVSSGCGSPVSAFRTLTVSPGTPATPGAITGATAQCPGLTGQTYSIAAVTNATTYTWTVPTGWTITAGAGTTSITVSTGTAGQNGNITTTAGNSCGTSAASALAVNINPNLTASISIGASANPVCSGTSVTLTATPANGGTTPSYQWKVNGINAGANSTIYTYTPTNNDVVTCILTSNASPCATGSPATSNTVNMTVNAIPTITGTTPASRCGTGTVILGASASAGTINWYNASSGGSSLITGTTYTTPVISANTTYFIDATNNGCTSVIRTSVLASIIPQASITAGGGGSFCINSNIMLTSSGTNIGNQYWEGPNNFYSLLQNPVFNNVTSSINGTYKVTGSSLSGINLVTNGDFESGNTGFSSSYIASSDLQTEGRYTVVANPGTVHPQFINCINHTSSGSLQMVINGAITTGDSVWSQTVNVITGTDYQFTYWVQSVVSSNPSQMQLYANGIPIGTVYTALTPTCQWLQFIYNWNSGSNTRVFLSLVNKNTIASGNDFALDDIIFQKVCPATSSINVTVNTTVTAGTIGNAQTICSGTIPATLTSVNVGTGSGTITYEWQTNASGTYVTIAGATSATYIPPALTATTSYHRRTVSVSGTTCYSSYTTPVTITISGPAPTSVAGTSVITCSNSGAVNITSGSSANNYATVTWTSGGTGTLSNATSLTLATYTPSAADITAGSITLTLTATGNAPCGNVLSTKLLTITTLPAAMISYTGTPFCNTLVTTQSVSRTGTLGGTYSALPSGLTIDAATGAIIPGTSTAGSYTVTYTIAAANGCGVVTATSQVTITVAPTATISYSGTPFCISVNSAQSATLSGTGTYTGGTYSSTTGLTINSGTGAIKPSTSTAGTYTVTYTIPAIGGCATVPVTTSLTITSLPVATFGYTGTPFCQNASNPSPTFSGGGISGIFSSTAGLVFISTATGLINLSASTAGAYTVTNTIAAVGGCAQVAATSSVTITKLPTATISYVGSPWCINAGIQNVSLIGTSGGTYSAPAGLSINASTGSITPGTSAAGTYNVTYSIAAAGGCSIVTATSSITINPNLPVNVSITASANNICSGNSITFIATPINGGTIPSYQWKINGNNVGANNSIYAYVPTNGDAVTCVLTSNASPCATGSPATSNTVTMIVNICINKWKGTAISNDWNIAANWTQNTVPATDANIIFDDAPLNHCQLDQNRNVTNITNAQSTYRMITNGYKLSVKGNFDFTNGAQIDASAINSTLEFAGVSAQSIPSGAFYNDAVYNLLVNNTYNVTLNGTLLLLNTITSTNGRLDAITNSPTVTYAGISAQTIGSQFLSDKIHNLTIDNTSGVTLSTNFTINNSLIINPTKLFTIVSTKQLTVEGIFTNNAGTSGFVMQSDASGTASLIHNTNNVPAIVQRYISGVAEDWHFLSSPVAAQSISGSWLPAGSYGNGSGYDLYAWNEPSSCWIYKSDITSLINWNTIHPGSNFVIDRGYLYSVQATNPTKEFIGNLNNGSLNYGLTSNSTNAGLKGFNLVGNPYPSSVDWIAASGWTRSVLINSGGGFDMWIWNPTANNYGVFNSFTATGTNNITRYISPMQGYFVRASIEGDLGINNNVRVHNGTGSWFKNTKSNSGMLSLVVQSEADNSSDEARLLFGYNSNQSGATKLFSHVVSAPSLFIPSANDFYSVRYLTDTIDNPIVAVMFKSGLDGKYTLKCNFNYDEFEVVMLEDRQMHFLQNMKTKNTYSFQSTTADDMSRFILHFGPDNNVYYNELPVRIYTDGTYLIIDLTLISKETEAYVYDALGRLLLQKTLQGTILHKLSINANSQILLVHLKNKQGNLNRKLFFNNKNE